MSDLESIAARTEADAVAELAYHVTAPQTAADGATPFVLVPSNSRLQSLEDTLPHPLRKRGTVKVRDAAGFIALTNRHAGESTMVYRTVDPPQFLAVIDDHGAAGQTPGWCQHRIQYDCARSPEWKTWTSSSGSHMQQEAFARFIEDNLPDIVEPRAADMLEISRSLQAKKKVNFASGLRLDNGQHQLTYEEQVEGRAGERGQLRVPETFKIGIAVFEGGPAYAVTARLRYRIAEGGKLTMWYDLERPHKILEHAVEQLREQIEAGIGRATINGSIG